MGSARWYWNGRTECDFTNGDRIGASQYYSQCDHSCVRAHRSDIDRGWFFYNPIAERYGSGRCKCDCHSFADPIAFAATISISVSISVSESITESEGIAVTGKEKERFVCGQG